jgi:hypothetical protein
MKTTADKPDEKSFTLAISQSEMVALIKWHSSQARSISKKFGQAVLTIQAKSIFGRSADVMALKKHCQAEIEKHGLRAKGLISLLK